MKVDVLGMSIESQDQRYYAIYLTEHELELLIENLYIPYESGSENEVKNMSRLMGKALNL